MGMAASQARFLGLTARKTNVEYEGQQINQQRTTLSNQTASYYTDLLGMTVPVPPSIEDYTKTVYTFQDGALNNSITSMIAKGNGLYSLSYTSEWTDDFAIVNAGKTSVINNSNGKYYIGSDELKKLAEDFSYAYIIKENEVKYRLYENQQGGYDYTDKSGSVHKLVSTNNDTILEQLLGLNKPVRSDYDSISALATSAETSVCYSDVSSSYDGIMHMEHNLCQIVWAWDSNKKSVTSSDGVTIERTDAALPYSTLTTYTNMSRKEDNIKLNEALQANFPEIYQRLIDLYVADVVYCNANLSNITGASKLNTSFYTITPADAQTSQSRVQLFSDWKDLWNEMKNLDGEKAYQRDLNNWNNLAEPYRNKFVDVNDYSKIYTVTERIMFYDGNNEYLKNLSQSQIENMYLQELDYKEMLNNTYGESQDGWYVRYVQNTTTGEYEPYFYNGDSLKSAIKDEQNNIRSSINTYKLGSKDIRNEVKNVSARLEQDTTGRIINVTLRPGEADEVTYAVTTNTVADQAKYDDAMNQYEYDKAQYDLAIQETNAKIEIIQVQDKNLELRLKQLDTEQKAIQTEMDAVSGVIEKNTQSSFKTFG